MILAVLVHVREGLGLGMHDCTNRACINMLTALTEVLLVLIPITATLPKRIGLRLNIPDNGPALVVESTNILDINRRLL